MDPVLVLLKRVRESGGTREEFARLLQEAGGSLDDFIGRVRRAYYKTFNQNLTYEQQGWVADVFPDHVIVSQREKFFKVGFSVGDDDITFVEPPDWEQVALTYVSAAGSTAETETPATEDAAPDAEAVQESVRLDIRLPFSEARKDGDLWDGVIVVEGVSANKNNYTKAALESGITAFDGVLMFADHPAIGEEKTRPERSVRDVVGRVSAPYIGTNKEGKTALRGKFKISAAESAIRTKIEEGILGDLSLRAPGRGKKDSATGEFVVEAFELNPLTSVDVVTVAAAGGAITLQESERQAALKQFTPEEIRQARPDLFESQSIGGQETRQLQESEQAELVSLREENARLFRETRGNKAASLLTEALAAATTGVTLPPATLDRIQKAAKSLSETFATHGSEQTDQQLKEAFETLVAAEKAYLAQVSPNGAVSGLTLSDGGGSTDDILKEAFEPLVPKGQLQIAVSGRG